MMLVLSTTWLLPACTGLGDCPGGAPVHLDADHDGFGAGPDICHDDAPEDEDYVVATGDCDDHDPDVNPGVTEGCLVPDGRDNNCDGRVDPACMTGIIDIDAYWHGTGGTQETASCTFDLDLRRTPTVPCPDCVWEWEVTAMEAQGDEACLRDFDQDSWWRLDLDYHGTPNFSGTQFNYRYEWDREVGALTFSYDRTYRGSGWSPVGTLLVY